MICSNGRIWTGAAHSCKQEKIYLDEVPLMDTSNKDIFISYKKRWFRDLKKLVYNVYFSSNEERVHSFPEHIRLTIENCKDLILVLSEGCFNQLKLNDIVD